MTTTLHLSCFIFDDHESFVRAAGAIDHDPQITECLPLSTCQRREMFILSRKELAGTASVGADAAERLFQIAAGALSEIPGERAVAEQLRRQLRQALRARQAGSLLAKLTRRALKAGETLRSRAAESATILELSDLVVAEIARWPRAAARGIVLLGAGTVGREIAAAAQKRGLAIAAWGTRHPPSGDDAKCRIGDALRALRGGDILITALGGMEKPLEVASLPRNVIAVDLGVPRNVCGATIDLRQLLERSRDALQPQAAAVARAAHRLRARAEKALAETLCPAMTNVNGSIAQFRAAIIDAELSRLEPTLARLAPAEAERIRRSIRHAAARSVHPLHEYVNALGRQGRADEAQTVVDHLLASRIGWTAASVQPTNTIR